MLKIRQSHDRLIFNMGILYLGKTVFILRQGQILKGCIFFYPLCGKTVWLVASLHKETVKQKVSDWISYFNGLYKLVQDCGISGALAVEIP